ncbi:thiamine-binding protein [Streptomyces sp. NPDC005953]|uniref:thiamine-binding protein n=1 Tax=unclassified Streptomyces TaxID=2593676 RepID=UPI003407FE14
MRLRVEFTTEPFDLDEPPAHATVARAVIEAAPLDVVEVGPFGNTVEGASDAVLAVLDDVLRRTVAAGATRVSVQLNVVREAGE